MVLMNLLYDKKIENKFKKILKENNISLVDSIWACSSIMIHVVPEYGYKIHISATPHNIIDIAMIIISYCVENNVLFKVVNSIDNLTKLNKGEYGFSQIGKAFTIYPKDFETFKNVIKVLHIKTRGFSSPKIPSDYRYFNSDCIFYRYGKLTTKQNTNNCINDLRISLSTSNSLNDIEFTVANEEMKDIFLIRSLSSRGKSVVYQGLNIKDGKPIIVKKGIKLGEYFGDNIDGSYFCLNEYMISQQLAHSLQIPKIHKIWLDQEDCFILREYVKGETLFNLIKTNKLNNDDVSIIFKQLSHLVSFSHKKNIVLNDISLNNFLYDKETKKVFFIDLEYSYNLKDSFFRSLVYDVYTPGFGMNGLRDFKKDHYAFLKVVYFLCHPNKYLQFKNTETENYKLSEKNENFILEIIGSEKQIISKQSLLKIKNMSEC
mgnify:CR=1 FL=1